MLRKHSPQNLQTAAVTQESLQQQSRPETSRQQKSRQRGALQRLKLAFLRLLQRGKGLLNAQTLPYVANKTCETYLGDADADRKRKCQEILQTRVEFNSSQLHHFFHTHMGETLLSWLGRLFQPRHPDRERAIKAVLLEIMADPEGLSILSFLRHFPETLQINIDQLIFASKQLELLLQETDATIAAVRTLCAAEAQAESPPDFASLPDRRNPGPFNVQTYTLELEAATPPWLLDHPPLRPLRVLCYQPQPWPTTEVAVVIQSHGLASRPEDLAPYAEHLASYGYFVAAPQHPGSDTEQVRQMLAGESPEVFQLTEFIDRPLDIRHLLDALEQRNPSDFENRLNLKAVGMMGYSFGAYTAFVLGGGTIHFGKLERACNPHIEAPNLSLLLQCQALDLPRQLYQLKDDRIQAIFSLDAVGSEIFGPQGIGQIHVPTLLVAGSQDAAAPLVFEQIRLFNWLRAPAYYLALMKGKAHIQDVQRLLHNLDVQIKLSPLNGSPRNGSPQSTAPSPTPPFEQYIKALSLAFFDQQIAQRPDLAPQLSAAYATYLSRPPFDLWFITQASTLALQQTLEVLDVKLMTAAMEVG
jgi:predicted dienelactone hydrolase